MIVWAKSRLAHMLAASVLLTVLVARSLPDLAFDVPSVIGGGASPLVLAAVAPLLTATVLAQGLAARRRPQETLAVRRRWLWDGWLVLVVLAVPLVASATSAPDVGASVVLRNTFVIPATAATIALWTSPVRAVGLTITALLATQSYAPSARYAEYVRLFQPELLPEAGVGLMLLVGASLAMSLLSTERRSGSLRSVG